MFSKACEYGIKAAIFIAQESMKGNRASLKEVADAIDSPVAFTAKILQSLAKDEIIDSVKGPTGGYEITDSQLCNATLLNIVSAIDGEALFDGCGLGLKACNEYKPCPVHFHYKAIRDELKCMLQTTTVGDLAKGVTEGATFLKT